MTEEPAKYFASFPLEFSRLHGPWPASGQGNARLHGFARSRFSELGAAGVLKWYTRATGQRAPRMPRPDALRFGLVELNLTAGQARQFRKSFREIRLVRDRVLRIRPNSTAPAGLVGGFSLWHLDETGVAVARVAGWASRGSGVTVAVVDSGIDASHPEFEGKSILSASYLPDGEMGGPVGTPAEGHGTHVAALIAGRTVGVAPEAGIVDVQAFADGSTTVGALIKALWFAATAPGVRVVNLSGGFTTFTPDFEQVFSHLAAAGILAVCAAGNRETGVDCPGIYESPITVGAMNKDLTVRTLSGSGSLQTPSGEVRLPDVIGPGEDVFSAALKDGFAALSGTSQSTAVVSGIAALRISDRHGNLSVADLVAQILTHTRKIPDPRAGQGLAFYNRIQ